METILVGTPVDIDMEAPSVVVNTTRGSLMNHRRAMTAPADLFAAAVLVEQAAVTVSALLVPAVLSLASASTLSLLQQYAVALEDSTLEQAIVQLDPLIEVLEKFPVEATAAPGFFLSSANGNLTGWTRASTIADYDTFPLHKDGQVPLPNAAFLAQTLRFVQQVLQLRLRATPADCACLSHWHFIEGNISRIIVNLALEQLMIVQATQVLNQTVDVPTWNQLYQASTLGLSLPPVPTHPNTHIRLLRHRDDYAQALVEMCLAAAHSIQLTTCYLFGADPFVRYLLLDLLPFCIRRNPNLTVQILCDWMTLEGAMVHAAFVVPTPAAATTAAGDVTETSFLQRLPPQAPPPASLHHTPSNMVDFLLSLLRVQDQLSAYQLRWWCAKDAQQHYRIKNHTKSIVIDRHMAIMGGSNVCPTMAAATTEIDMVVFGPVVGDLYQSNRQLWHAMDESTTTITTTEQPELTPSTPSAALQHLVQQQEWSTLGPHGTEAQFLRSNPSSRGQDTILYKVLEAIAHAKISIHMCFGHSNFPQPVCQALREATDRGVQVQLMVNSMYSCDLRGGQQDLFRSLQNLLRLAPQVQVYSTDLLLRHDDDQQALKAPFIHAKYVTIDGNWSAVGSWNLWHRAAFFEMEHELFLPHCPEIAKGLIQKFEQDKIKVCSLVSTPKDCCRFLPSGCVLCRGFGPFYPC